MEPSIFRISVLVFIVFASAAMAGSHYHYTRMVESKPVVVNGFEFTAAVEDEWVCFNPRYEEAPIQVQLFIRNTTSEPMLLSVFDSFRIVIKDMNGKDFGPLFSRDHSLGTKDVSIDAGGRYCLSRKAVFRWSTDGKSRILKYEDGTGAVWSTTPLAIQGYTLSFQCEVENDPLKNANAATRKWTGKAVTPDVAFKIVDP